MCFSATASFSAGIILSTIGVVSVKKAESKSQLAFASIPIIFAIQQITEGILWLALTNPDFAFLKEPCTYIFLFFAQVVWPFWVPYSILKLEKYYRKITGKRILKSIGAIVSLYLGYCLIVYPVNASISGMHITYDQAYPASLSLIVGLLYIIATIVPPFYSSFNRMWLLGVSILISYIITSVFYTDYVVSVWCFFASIISITVYVIILEMKKSKAKADINKIEFQT
ncbi:MAG: hypothetical protein IPI60_13510 [Saprospiraceae bacterium]|nr:hypothetical protein [Saprospiraceae bacterium]